MKGDEILFAIISYSSVAGLGHDFVWQGVSVKLLLLILKAKLSLTILPEHREAPAACKSGP